MRQAQERDSINLSNGIVFENNTIGSPNGLSVNSSTWVKPNSWLLPDEVPYDAPDWVKKAWIPPHGPYDYWKEKDIVDCSPPGSGFEFFGGPMGGKVYAFSKPPNYLPMVNAEKGYYELQKELWTYPESPFSYTRKYYKFIPDKAVPETANDGDHVFFTGNITTLNLADVDPQALSILKGETPNEEEPTLWEQI
jgi:hypothetical protein